MIPRESTDDGVPALEPGCLINPICVAEENLIAKVQNSMVDAMESVAVAISEAVGQIAASMGTLWLFFSPAQMALSGGARSGRAEPLPPPPSSQNVETLLGWVAWVSLGVVVISIMVIGAMLAAKSRRGEGAEHVGKLLIVLVSAVIIGSASALAGVARGVGPSAAGSGVVLDVQQHLWWYVGAAAVVSIIVGAARMAWDQSAQHGKDLVKSLITLALVSGASVTGATLALQAADGFALWILFGDEGAAGEDFGDRILGLLGMTAVGAGPAGAGLALFLVIVFGILASIVSMIQIILMIIRDGFLVVIIATLPLAAALTTTEIGKQWFKKSLAWMFAFIMYKPAAAIIYAVAFFLVGDTSSDTSVTILNVMTGLSLMMMALVALPALMRIAVPGASMGGSGSAAALSGIAGVVGGQLASGAMDKLGSMGSQGAESGSGPTGAPISGPSNSSQQGDNPPTGAQPQGQPDQETSPQSPAPGAEQQDDNSPTPNSPGGDMPTGDGAPGADPYSAALNEFQERVDSAGQAADGIASDALEGPDGHQ